MICHICCGIGSFCKCQRPLDTIWQNMFHPDAGGRRYLYNILRRYNIFKNIAYLCGRFRPAPGVRRNDSGPAECIRKEGPDKLVIIEQVRYL